MKQIKMILWILTLSVHTHIIHADNRIIVLIKHAPGNVLQAAEQEANQMNLADKIAAMEIHAPSAVSQKMVKYALRASLRPNLGGIVAIYGGYMDISDRDGLISFPLRHITPKLYLAITPRIELINIKGNTFAHREYATDDQNPTNIYSFELKQDAKKYTYWDVQEEQVPQDKKINPITLVLLANPKNMYVPLGQFMTTPNVQLILPDIYITGQANNEQALLTALDIRRYFEPITIEQKKAGEMVLQKMITNL